MWAVRGDGVTAYVGTSLEDEREVIVELTRSLVIGLPLLVVLLRGRHLADGRPDAAAGRGHPRRGGLDLGTAGWTGGCPRPPTNDEIGRLARTMNEMLGRLEDASNRQRDFVGNASHELRSPLAAFRTQLEVAAAHPDGVDWPSLAADLLADSNRMEGLVQDLLFLAREDGEDTRPLKPVDLDDIVLEEVARMRSTCPAEVHTEGVSGAPLLGHGDDLARLVRNLLDNACSHASSRGRRVARDDRRPRRADRRRRRARSRAGGPAADLRAVLPRRSGPEPADAAAPGLGLAIAASVAEAHGGTHRRARRRPGSPIRRVPPDDGLDIHTLCM